MPTLEAHVKLPRERERFNTGDWEMRIGLLIVAGLALIGFIVVAVVLPQMAGTESKEAAQALVSGADPARQQVSAVVEKSGSLSGAGKGVKIAARNDPRHGELKWLVAEDGAIRGWNEKNALEVALTPSVQSGKVSWNCKGYPVSAMPSSCGGR
jgi:hypothetical protein